MRRSACLLLLAIGFGTSLSYGQPAADNPKSKRFLYLIRNGDAKSLATTLTQHFKGEAGLQIVPEDSANALLITAPPALLDEMTKLLEQLDRRPRQVLIDVLIVEVPLLEKENGFDPADFNGPGETILLKVEGLARKAKLNHLRRFQIAALENQRSSKKVGESRPFVAGVNDRIGGPGKGGGGFGGGAGAQPMNIISYHEIGTTLSALPRIGGDGTVMLDLKLEESRANTPENGIVLGPGANATEFIKTSFDGKISVASGKCVLADSVKSEAKNLKVQALVVVAAKIIEK